MNLDTTRSSIGRRCITRIVTNPIRNPKILKIVDEIIEAHDFSIEDLLYILMSGIGDDLLDNDPDYTFDPHGHYCPIVYDHLTAIDGDDDFSQQELAYIDNIAMSLSRMHDIYLNSFPWHPSDHPPVDHLTHQCEVKSADGSPVTEDNRYEDFMLVFIPRQSYPLGVEVVNLVKVFSDFPTRQLRESMMTRQMAESVTNRLNVRRHETKSRHSI